MRNQWKRLLSVLVVVALVITMLPVQSAQAAAKPALSVTKKTLLVGSKTTLKVKNVASNAKFTWKSSNKDAVAVSQKGLVKAKEAGESVVTCKVQTAGKSYTLKANITVKDSVVVATQKELKKALANEGITKIKIKTDAEKKFTISKGDYTNKLLIVDAPKADVVNNGGVFKRIAIRSINPNTWIERAEGNKFSVSAPESRIVVGKDASVKAISFTKEGAAAKVDVRGEVAKVAVNAPIDLNVVGSAQEVKVEVAPAAEGVKIVAEVPVNVTAETNVTVELGKGAEGSTITTTDSSVQVEVKNETASNVVVATPEGNQTVNAGSSSTTSGNSAANNNNTSTGGSSSSSSSSGGGSISRRYKLQRYGRDLIITPADGWKNDLVLNASNWEVRLNREVAADAKVTVNGTSLAVNGESIVTLPKKTAITGVDANGNVVNGTADITWSMADPKATGVYTVMGRLGMPRGWSNEYNRSIALAFIVTSQVPENLCDISYIGCEESTFLLEVNDSAALDIVVTGGAITISSADVLNGDLLSVVDGKLKYDGEVLGTLPKTVWVEGPKLKDSEAKWDFAELPLSWWNSLEYDRATGTYIAIANVITNDNWINTAGRAAQMRIRLVSNAVEIKPINIWAQEDAELYSERFYGGRDISAAVTTGSAIYADGNVDVVYENNGTITVTYKLAGSLPAFKRVEGIDDETARHYILFSLEKPNASGKWARYEEGSLTPIGDGYGFTFTDDDRLIHCNSLGEHLQGMRMVLFLDVDMNNMFNAGDIMYIIDCAGIERL